MNPECINKAGCPHDRCIPENCQSYETADSLSLPTAGSADACTKHKVYSAIRRGPEPGRIRMYPRCSRCGADLSA